MKRERIKSERGQGTTEYIVLIILVALVLIPFVKLLPKAVQGYVRPFFIQLSGGRDGSALRVLATPNVDDNRYPQLWDLDLRVAKDIKIAGTARFNIAADLFNVVNSNTELGRVRRLNSSTFGQLNDILSPRILRLTFGVKF